MIKVIVFDLGGVLIEIDYPKFLNNLSTRFHIELSTLLTEPNNNIHKEYMRGNISSNQYYELIRQKYNIPGSIDDFRKVWNTILIRQNNDVAALVEKLSGTCRLALMSNIDPWHYEYCATHFPVISIFKQRFLSYEKHLLKPESEFYHLIASDMNVRPDECLLIDDLQENIAGAKATGFQAIHYVNVRQLSIELSDLKISIFSDSK